MKKIFGSIVVVLAGILTFTACGSKKVAFESAFPEESGMAFVFDYSDETQRDNLAKLSSNFPAVPYIDLLLSQLNKALIKENMSFEKDVKPILTKPGKLGVAMDFSGLMAKSAEERTENVRMVISWESEAADDLKSLLVKAFEKDAEKDKSLKYKIEGGVDYWMLGGDLAVAKYKNTFLMAKYLDIDKAVGGLKNGGGLADNKSFQSAFEGMTENSLGYFYVSKDLFKAAYKQRLVNLTIDEADESYLKILGSIFYNWSAESDGFRSLAKTELIGDAKAIGEVYENRDYKAALYKKINADGMMFYYEIGSFNYIFKLVADGYGEGLGEYGEVLKYLADGSGLSTAEVSGLLNSPFALTASYTGGTFPNFAFYFQLNADQIQSAKKLVNAFDANMDKLIKELDADLQASADPKIPYESAVKKEVVLVQGGAFNKVIFDWKNLNNSGLADFKELAGVDLGSGKVELYYGVTGDNVLVLSVYPGFEKNYSKNVLADDEQFKEAMSRVGTSGYSQSYVVPRSLVDFYMKLVGALIQKDAEKMAPDKYMAVKLISDYLFKFLNTFKYFSSSSVIEGNVVKADSYMRLEKVK